VSANQFIRWVVKPAVFVAALYPAGWIIWAAYTGNLSADPLVDITHRTGDWTLRFLCITLAITPLRRFTGWNSVIRFRRMLGLFAFFYGSSHFLIYVVADRFAGLVEFPQGIVSWDTAARLAASIWDDIYQRPYITVGFSALVLMIPLAVTSTAGWIRRLGGRNWRVIHRLIYPAAILGVVHYWWLVKADIRDPAMYGAIVAVLLGIRVYWSRRRLAVGATPTRATAES
jgi:sulfoxide reductase heme-binding subunit YedZ